MADIHIAEAALYPSLDTSCEQAAAIGVEFRIPLYQGGGEYARIRRARQEVGRFEDDLKAVTRAVATETSQTWQNFREAPPTIGSLIASGRQWAKAAARKQSVNRLERGLLPCG